eukprot:TRINITY_DN1_c0_g1_i1.p1 TRINITY_DN1_c0_g1~~TRINITY_DN1_c0_g1_i1.p1  ORF type:complete len:172 (-),score=37.22 TRINITY_DN1_c0_g1_i1:223-738(-)
MDKDWRCQRYGPLGWAEALVKVLGIGVAIASLKVYNDDDNQPIGDNTKRIVQIAFMAIMGAVLVAQIVQRVLDKELFALSFIILHVIGHWIMVLVLILSRLKDYGQFLFSYCFLMVFGEFIRCCYLFLAENIEVKYLTKPIMFGISAFFIVFHIVVIILQGVIWVTDYESA